MIKNAKLSGYYFYMNLNIWGNFQICISVPLRVLKSKKKKLAQTSFYCLRQETWLDDSWKLIHVHQSRFYNFFHMGKFKYFKDNFEIF